MYERVRRVLRAVAANETSEIRPPGARGEAIEGPRGLTREERVTSFPPRRSAPPAHSSGGKSGLDLGAGRRIVPCRYFDDIDIARQASTRPVPLQRKLVDTRSRRLRRVTHLSGLKVGYSDCGCGWLVSVVIFNITVICAGRSTREMYEKSHSDRNCIGESWAYKLR